MLVFLCWFTASSLTFHCVLFWFFSCKWMDLLCFDDWIDVFVAPALWFHRWPRDLLRPRVDPVCISTPTESPPITSTPRLSCSPVSWSHTCSRPLPLRQLPLPLLRTSTTPGPRTPSTLRPPRPPQPPPPTSSTLTRPRRRRRATWPQRGTATPSSSRSPQLPPRELRRLLPPSASINLSSSRQIACSKTLNSASMEEKSARPPPPTMKAALHGETVRLYNGSHLPGFKCRTPFFQKKACKK